MSWCPRNIATTLRCARLARLSRPSAPAIPIRAATATATAPTATTTPSHHRPTPSHRTLTTTRPILTSNAGSQQGTLHQAPLKYTTDAYPDLQRDPRFAQLTPEHVSRFKSILDNEDAAVIDGVTADNVAEDIEPYNGDWMHKYRGHTRLVLRPKTTQQVSSILRYCNEERLAVVPQGGNTGLVGGSVPVFDEIVLSMGRMNGIRSFDGHSGVLVCDGGVILEVADNYLREREHIFPLDLGAKGSCMVGGNVATNAGGLRLLRYGSLHGSVLGVEAVLPDGTVVDDLARLRKNNTGYDLKQLFIGSEGTLGVITGVSVLCPQKPKAVNVAYLAVDSYEKLLATFAAAKQGLSEILSAFELMDANTQALVHRVTELKPPLDGVAEGAHPFYCLIETSGSDGEHDMAKLEAFLEQVMGEELVADGVLAQDETQAQTLWRWREGITESLSQVGKTYKYDVSIPLEELYAVVEDARSRFRECGVLGEGEGFPVQDVVGYGHMGDGNLHLNVSVRNWDKKVEKVIEPWVYEWIAKRKGSISAEHGLGLAKRPYVGYSRDETALGVMRQLKKLFDPNGIMNPYKYI